MADIENYDGQGKSYQEEVDGSMRVLAIALLLTMSATAVGIGYIAWRLLG